MLGENEVPVSLLDIDVLMFGELREIFGAKVPLQVPVGSTLDQIRQELVRQRPIAEVLLNHSLLAINGQHAELEQVIAEWDEVACIPPVSGG